MRRALAAAALALLAAACSTDGLQDGASRIEYKSAQKLPPLDVPPDLTAPARDGRYQVPDSARSTATLSGYQAGRAQQPRGDPSVLPSVEGVRIERDGNQRWLVVDQPAERLWPAMKSFWVENGLLIALEVPEAGVMETDWAENRALIIISPITVIGPGLALASLVVGLNLFTDWLARLIGRTAPRAAA